VHAPVGLDGRLELYALVLLLERKRRPEETCADKIGNLN
jgi:hypothetical protein